MKDPQWYAVQGSDTTMMTKAASWFGQKRNGFIEMSDTTMLIKASSLPG